MINKWQFCAAKQAKSANYAGSAFFRGIQENYACNDELMLPTHENIKQDNNSKSVGEKGKGG